MCYEPAVAKDQQKGFKISVLFDYNLSVSSGVTASLIRDRVHISGHTFGRTSSKMFMRILMSVLTVFIDISLCNSAEEVSQYAKSVNKKQFLDGTPSTPIVSGDLAGAISGSLKTPRLSFSIKEVSVLAHASRSVFPPTVPADADWKSRLNHNNDKTSGDRRPLPLAVAFGPPQNTSRSVTTTTSVAPIHPVVFGGESETGREKTNATIDTKPDNVSGHHNTSDNRTDPDTVSSVSMMSQEYSSLKTVEQITTESLPETTTTSKDFGACVSSPCFHDGKCHDGGTDKFRCVCGKYNGLQYAGFRCQIKLTSNPMNHRINPTYGPVAGGTVITVEGSYLSPPLHSIYLSHDGKRYPCDVIKSNESHIVATTPKVPVGAVGRSLTVEVVLAGEVRVDSLEPGGLSFDYRQDPQIEELHPLETITSGGTFLTVIGHSLDAVATPVLRVITTYTPRDRKNVSNQNQTVFYETCHANNGTVMICAVPQLEIPAIEQRYDGNSTNSSGETTVQNTTSTSNRIPRSLINEEKDHQNSTLITDLTFHIGFIMDGLTVYRNLFRHPELRRFGRLSVYPGPLIHLLQSGEFINYWDGMELEVQGADLLSGVQLENYRIVIGDGECIITYLDDTLVQCTPPPEAPNRTPDDPIEGYTVIVHIGRNLQYPYGTLLYGSTNIAAIVGPIVGGIVLVVVIVLIAILIRNHRQKRKRTNKYRYSPVDRVLPPPISMDDLSRTPEADRPDDNPFATFRPDFNIVHENHTGGHVGGQSKPTNQDTNHANTNHFANTVKTQEKPKVVPELVIDKANGSGEVPEPSKNQTLPSDATSSFGHPVDYLKVSGNNVGSTVGSVSSLASSNQGYFESDDGFSDVDGVYENQTGDSKGQGIDYANLNSFHSPPDVPNAPPGNKGRGYTSRNFNNLKPKNAPLPELPHEHTKKKYKYAGHDKPQRRHSPKDDRKSKYANFNSDKSPSPDRPQRYDKYTTQDNSSMWPKQDMFYGTYKSDSEEDEQIYMNSPIKSRGYRSGRRGRARPGHGPKVATLWY